MVPAELGKLPLLLQAAERQKLKRMKMLEERFSSFLSICSKVGGNDFPRGTQTLFLSCLFISPSWRSWVFILALISTYGRDR